jgi:hypothetical protein
MMASDVIYVHDIRGQNTLNVGQQKLSRVAVCSTIACSYCEITVITTGHTIVSSNSK